MACARFEGTPVCLGGECVASCPAGTQYPDYCNDWVCAEGGGCRTCQSDAECLSGVCWEGSQYCLWEDDILFVEAGASTTSDCTRDDPCGSIQRAVELADGYRTNIHVTAGVYAESVRFDARTSDGLFEEFNVIGEPGVVIAPTSGPAVSVEQGRAVTLANVELHGASGVDGIGFHCEDVTVRIWNALVRDGGGHGISIVDCIAEIKDTSIVGHGGHGIEVSGGDSTVQIIGSRVEENVGVGAHLNGCGRSDMRRTVILGNGGGGIDAGCHFVGANLLVVQNGSDASMVGGVRLDSDYGEVHFTTIADNIAAVGAPAAGVTCNTPGTYLHDNIVANNVGGAPQYAACKLRSSLVTPGPRPQGNFDGDPDFVAPSEGNYDIGPASAAIGQAIGEFDSEEDVHGEARGAAPWDSGADEYHEP